VKRLVVDAPVLASWFWSDGNAAHLRGEYEAGALVVLGPAQLLEDTLAAIAEPSSADAESLARIGSELRRLGLQLQRPPIGELARWIARGVPAHRAAYLAVGSHLDVPFATNDEAMLSASPSARTPDRC
jgi:predicted nucleic acid-binding protein